MTSAFFSQNQLEEGVKFLTPQSTTEERSTLSLFVLLLKAQCYYNTGQVCHVFSSYFCVWLRHIGMMYYVKYCNDSMT